MTTTHHDGVSVVRVLYAARTGGVCWGSRFSRVVERYGKPVGHAETADKH